MWEINILSQSVCLFCHSQICGLILGIYKSLKQTHESGRWGWGHAIPRKGIHKWNFGCSVVPVPERCVSWPPWCPGHGSRGPWAPPDPAARPHLRTSPDKPFETSFGFPVDEDVSIHLKFLYIFSGGRFIFSLYYIQHCFICRPSDSTVPTDAGIEPRTVATGCIGSQTL
jgi:hypothetical protein